MIKSGSSYKIGKTKNLDKRFSNYLTHNPDCTLYLTIAGDFEKTLHALFESSRVSSNRDWFKLNRKQLSQLRTIAANHFNVPILPK